MAAVKGSAYQVKFVHVAATTDGDNEVVAAVTGKKIRVIAFAITADAAGDVIFKDTGGTEFATFALAQNGGVSFAGGVDCPAFETSVSTGLEINTGTNVDTQGFVTYQVVDD